MADPVVSPTFGIDWQPWDLDAEMDAEARVEWNAYVELTKNKLAFEYRSAILNSRHRNRIRDLYANDTTWTQRNGTVIRIEDMTPNHANNTLRLMRRKGVLQARTLRCDPLDLEQTPLMVALRSRSLDPESILDRIKDKHARRQWEKGKPK